MEHFDNYEDQLHFQRTKDGDGRRRKSFSVTMGIMPDYVSEIQGLAVDGVTADRPADRAGIVKGDVIIKMGALVINDIYDYMNALGKFRKGQIIEVIVLRDADTVAVTVDFN